jgi:hypothetical protein
MGFLFTSILAWFETFLVQTIATFLSQIFGGA